MEIAAALFILVILAVGVVVYFVPAIVADQRKLRDVTTIKLLNLFLAWIPLVWIFLVFWACWPTTPKKGQEGVCDHCGARITIPYGARFTKCHNCDGLVYRHPRYEDQTRSPTDDDAAEFVAWRAMESGVEAGMPRDVFCATCGSPLRAKPGAHTIRCATCGDVYNAKIGQRKPSVD